MYWLLYLSVGVLVTLLHYVVLGVIAHRHPEYRADVHELGALVFVASILVWPIDLVVSIWKLIRVVCAVLSAWMTTRRLTRAQK